MNFLSYNWVRQCIIKAIWQCFIFSGAIVSHKSRSITLFNFDIEPQSQFHYTTIIMYGCKSYVGVHWNALLLTQSKCNGSSSIKLIKSIV